MEGIVSWGYLAKVAPTESAKATFKMNISLGCLLFNLVCLNHNFLCRQVGLIKVSGLIAVLNRSVQAVKAP